MDADGPPSTSAPALAPPSAPAPPASASQAPALNMTSRPLEPIQSPAPAFAPITLPSMSTAPASTPALPSISAAAPPAPMRPAPSPSAVSVPVAPTPTPSTAAPELARSTGSDAPHPSQATIPRALSNTPQASTSPKGAAQIRPTPSPHSTFAPMPPMASQIAPTPRLNPMSMSSLLSNGEPSPLPASSPAIPTSGPLTRPVQTPQPTPHHHHPAPSYPQPMHASAHEQAFYEKQRQQRQQAEWGSQGGQGGRPPSGSVEPPQPGSARYDYHAFDKKRQSSENAPRTQAPSTQPQQSDPRMAYEDQSRRQQGYEFSGRLGQPQPGHSHSQSLPHAAIGPQATQQHRPPVQPTNAQAQANPYPNFNNPAARQDQFFAGAHGVRPLAEGSDVNRSLPPPQQQHQHQHQQQAHHHHHHHHAQSAVGSGQPPRKSEMPVTTAAPVAQNAWNKAFAPSAWPPSLPSRPSDEKTQQSHKRKRGDWQEGVHPGHENGHPPTATAQHPPPSATAQAAALKRPPGPLFTASDLERISIRPKLLATHSDKVQAVLKSVTKDEARVVARVTWDPLVEPAALLDGAMLARNVGQKVKVVVDGRWLGEGVDVGDPARFEPVPTSPVSDRQGANASLAREGEKMAKRGASLADWTAWDLEPLRKRKVWGSEVYTDDSDVLAMCLHTGWVRYRHEGALSGSVTPKAIEVTLQVAPRLVRYQGSLRGGIKSRSWGNGHDGVSLIVVEVKPLLSSVGKLSSQAHGDDRRRRRKGGMPLHEIGSFGVQDTTVSITTKGFVSTAYKPDVAARLAQALLQDSTPTTTGDDVKMRADDSDDEDIFDETPVERLSLRGYVLLLLSGSKTHELAATAAGTLRVDAHADIAATDLEFDEQGVIVRSIDGSERARFAVDRLSWRRA